jgi:hypothetical protein
MAKELETLRSRRAEDAVQSLTESPSIPGSIQDSPDHPTDHPGKATVVDTGLTQDEFQLDEFTIDKETVVGIFSMCVAYANASSRFADFWIAFAPSIILISQYWNLVFVSQ